MHSSYLSAFEIRQEMRRDDFEIFYRKDSAPGTIPLHHHDFFELYCLLSGDLEYQVEGRRYMVKPGMLLLVAPGENHQTFSSDPKQEFERIVLWMSRDFVNSLSSMLPRIVESVAKQVPGWNLITPDDDTYQVLTGLLFSLLYEKELADADSPFLSRLIVMQLLVHLNRFLAHSHAERTERQDRRYASTLQVYEYINGHFRENITVSSLAKQFFMDKNTLTRHFKRMIGLTPGEYIRRKRLESARDLIYQGFSAQEAGYRNGFSDYSAFYRAFRQEYGQSPGAIAAQVFQTEDERHGK